MKLKLKLLMLGIISIYFDYQVATSAYGQAPQKFNYQGIARDTKGTPLAKQSLTLKLSVLPTSDATVPEYEEIQKVMTNEFGLYTLQIGNGVPVTGSMDIVKWETGNKYIKVAIDMHGGENYVDAGTTQLLSVPYALFADKAGMARETFSADHGGTRTGAVNSSATHIGADANFLSKFTALNVIGKSQVFDNGTNVGINNTSPSARLQLSSNPYSGTLLPVTELRIQHLDTINNASRLSFFNDGNTGFTTGGEYAVLNKYAKGKTGNYATGFPFSRLFTFANSKGSLIFATGGNIGFGYFDRATSVTTTRLFIDSTSGNVGIGTITPASKLEVNGQVKITGGAPGAGKVLTSDATGLATWQTPASGGSSQWTTSGTNIFSNNTGKVGIGISSPTTKLHVTDTASAAITGSIRGEYTGATTTVDNVGVFGRSNIVSGFGIGVQGEGGNFGVKGTGETAGVTGTTNNIISGYGVSGFGGLYGVGTYGYSYSGEGVNGESFAGNAMKAYSIHGTALSAETDSSSAGLFNVATPIYSPALNIDGVLKGSYTGTYSQDAIGVYGRSAPASNWGFGVAGYGGSAGVFGSALDTFGYAGYFDGKLYATSASSGIKAFKIDHPLDPENKFLLHSSVESNDMMNIYNGNINTDANGDATVMLPSYFEALNIDYKYQLTVIGSFAQAMISEELANNQFKIKTSQPNIKVSWQITGVRNDAMAKAHRIANEVEKIGREKGKYLNPVENGHTLNEGIFNVEDTIKKEGNNQDRNAQRQRIIQLASEQYPAKK